MTPEEVHAMPMVDKIRKIKVLTPGEYGLHAWIDGHDRNGLLIDTVLLTVAAGGTVWRQELRTNQ